MNRHDISKIVSAIVNASNVPTNSDLLKGWVNDMQDDEEFETSPKMTKRDLMKEIKSHYIPDIPDINKLIEQDLGRIANRLVAGVKDRNGRREIFAIEDGGERKLIYVDKSKSLSDVKQVYNSLVTAKKGYKSTVSPFYKKPVI